VIQRKIYFQFATDFLKFLYLAAWCTDSCSLIESGILKICQLTLEFFFQMQYEEKYVLSVPCGIFLATRKILFPVADTLTPLWNFYRRLRELLVFA
jgi:hypothetical protein